VARAGVGQEEDILLRLEDGADANRSPGARSEGLSLETEAQVVPAGVTERGERGVPEIDDLSDDDDVVAGLDAPPGRALEPPCPC